MEYKSKPKIKEIVCILSTTLVALFIYFAMDANFELASMLIAILAMAFVVIFFPFLRLHWKVIYEISNDKIVFKREGRSIKEYKLKNLKSVENRSGVVIVYLSKQWKSSIYLYPESGADEIVSYLNQTR